MDYNTSSRAKVSVENASTFSGNEFSFNPVQEFAGLVAVTDGPHEGRVCRKGNHLDTEDHTLQRCWVGGGGSLALANCGQQNCVPVQITSLS